LYFVIYFNADLGQNVIVSFAETEENDRLDLKEWAIEDV
jgi:hypothetical protein